MPVVTNTTKAVITIGLTGKEPPLVFLPGKGLLVDQSVIDRIRKTPVTDFRFRSNQLQVLETSKEAESKADADAAKEADAAKAKADADAAKSKGGK